MDNYSIATLCLILLLASIIDLRSQRIPNALTLPTALAALAHHLLLQGPEGLWFSLSGLGIGLGLLFVPFLLGVMGGGDVKLLAAVGAWLGAQTVFTAFVYTSLIGGVYALSLLAYRAPLRQVLWRRFTTFLCTFPVSGALRQRSSEAALDLPKLCYGLAISLGTACAMVTAALQTGWPILVR